MTSRFYATSVVALLLGACGGGSSTTEVPAAQVAANSDQGDQAAPEPAEPPSEVTLSQPPPSSTQPPPAVNNPATPLPAGPEPVTSPVAPRPLPPLLGEAPQPAQPTEGGYVLGSWIRRAIEAGDGTYRVAAEAPPGSDTVWLRSHLEANGTGRRWMQEMLPRPDDCIRCLPNRRAYPPSWVNFGLGLSPSGFMTLSSAAETSWTSPTEGDQRFIYQRAEGDFEIRDDFKYLLNKTASEWRHGPGMTYFVQLQLATYPMSDNLYKLCLHQFLGGVRRLACSLHDKDTAELRGVHVIDDSTGEGPVEHRSPL